MSNSKKLKLDLDLEQYFKQGSPKRSNISKSDILSPQYVEQQLTCKSHEPQKTNHILLFTVLNPTYPDLKYSPPVTCNVLNNICSPIGKVLRIVIFKKNGVQAMVEFESVDAAKTAKENLHGSDIYSGKLKIEYSKRNKLNVYKNDSNTYDFTNPNLGKGFDMDSTNGYSTRTTSQQQPNQNAYKNMDLREKIPKEKQSDEEEYSSPKLPLSNLSKKSRTLSPEPSKSLPLPCSNLSAPNEKESLAKFHKIKEILATKIFLANASDENLISLLNDDIEKLFEKYDQIVTSTKDSEKLKEITETLADVKVKLLLQTKQRELYYKQLNEIMDFLNFSKNNRCFGDILPALKELKESCELQEKIETDHYSKAQSLIETFTT